MVGQAQTPQGAAPRRGRPRDADTDRRILTAGLELLRAGGPRAVTVEAVADSSGVAKTTIYRRYADRHELLRAALVRAIGEPGQPPDTDPGEKIRWALNQTWQQMSDVLGPGGLAAIIGDTDRRFTDGFRRILLPYTDALVALIEADVAAGKLGSDFDADAAVSMMVGAYLGELLRRGTVDAEFTDQCIQLMLVAMTAGRK
ncbi:TetR/AcrR family transcriptional regulator [Nocardioides sp. HM23]|uniref:TetR/AcrR family transcriptional regulator n=1 Tax=Nocardioides bizhenqiangii TaxID=3095076 RepID=UPI002ACA9A77|nr:TetR/AcrR family transcriptional regulator [Nocardioides sp. HM23]MDZ5622860.1 TetR/AcrR family transcriptional regulator [Nocardioides sp. HM23]